MPLTSTPLPSPAVTSPATLTPTHPDTPYSPITTMDRAEDSAGLPQHLQQETSNSSHSHEKTKSPWHHQPRKALWARFRGKGRKRIGIYASLKAIALSSWLNVFLIFIPFAWAAHFKVEEWGTYIVFALSFLSMIPLESLFDFGGEQMALYCGKQLGDLIVVSLNNAVEAALAIILLTKCDLKLLQSTLAGVVLLHLLLVPGMAFLTGGARILHQNLHSHPTQLNQTLLTIGVLSLLVPAAFFSALNPGAASAASTTEGTEPFLNDILRTNFLSISRGIAIILLVVYICSRVYLYNPPGDGNALKPAADAPEEIHRLEEELAREEPKVNPWVLLCMLVIAVAIMAATAEWLVESIEFVRERSNITKEWFGIILLPLVSFSGDAAVAIAYFLRTVFFLHPEAPATLAKGRAIDLSIQFTLFWMPFLVLLGWWTDKPLSLLFDLYEVAIMIGACFLVNYVTADSKTNWAEGVILCAFYVMIALVSWYYEGQIEVLELLQCEGIAEVLTKVAEGGEATLE